MRKTWKAASIAATLVVLTAAAVALTPYAMAELFMASDRLHIDPLPAPANPAAFRSRPGSAAGQVVDGYWRVQQIGPATWAIGEPQNDPDNYEYLLLGRTGALLIDAGSTRRDIRPVVARLTHLPVTVIPSHLHFDHTNGLINFTSIALIDLPQTRARERNGVVRLGRYQFLAYHPIAFRVTRWVRPGETIDLGDRRVQVLSTPGHTPTSVSIHDAAAKLLFTGDLIYPTTLYAFVPGSSLSAYVATADRLLATLPADTVIYGAHCCRNDAPPGAPWLSMNDLRDVRTAVQQVRAGKVHGRGFVIRRFPVNARMTLLTLYPFANW